MSRSYNRPPVPKIGEIYMMKFTGHGSAQAGWRPGVIFQNNIGNRYSPNVIALPLTSSLKKLGQPTHIVIRASDSGLRQDSMVLCENPVIISKENLGVYITRLSDEYMRRITIGYLLASSAISYLDSNSLLDVWRNAAVMNDRQVIFEESAAPPI